ncbi:uncharacterized protein LOC135386399 [Ornithodoros turicata]|uniref:uncharacterized protein LOC135386399 n=1 Tax=Ornithodoros turicata TaxID=34597 RepID=UPI003139FAD1
MASCSAGVRYTDDRSTGFTPAILNLGRGAPLLEKNALGLRDGTQPLYSRYAEYLQSRLDVAARTARENFGDVVRLDQARQYSRARRNLTYSVGDLVLRRTHPLSDAWRGFAASLTDRLRRCDTGEETVPLHISDLKAFDTPTEGRPIISRLLPGPGPGFRFRSSFQLLQFASPQDAHVASTILVAAMPPPTPGRSPGASLSTARPPVPSRSEPLTHRSVATWTVVAGERPVSWASRSRWTSQPRLLRTDHPAKVPIADRPTPQRSPDSAD